MQTGRPPPFFKQMHYPHGPQSNEWNDFVPSFLAPKMSSLVQLPSQPSSAFQLDFDAVRNFQNVPPVDLEGGTLIDATEEEEIDPVDGCTVRVFTYRILSADEMEELTKTVRQKIKFDCTQTMRSLKMIGSEANVVEKSQRISGDIKGMKPIEFSNNSKQICLDQHSLQLDPNDEQDQQISRVLNQVPNTFMSLLSREKDMFVKLYPELFEKMRTESSLIPSTTTEIITNPDGSTTTRVKSSKSYSSHFSRQETYVNGVKKMSKSKFRAFVEYKGPDGGFQVKLSDGDEFELSEDEQEDDDTSLSQSCYSEIDSESDITGPSPKTDLDKRYQKAWYAAKELVDSEQRYVDKLKLLGDTFRNRLIKEELITNDKITRLLANVSSLYQFHNTHFLPQLLESIRDWHTTKRIANVVRKQAPFLKMYSEYTNNYDRATKLFEELKKKKKFADVVKEIEKQAECEGLPLGHHLICPVQRVMRYQLLLQEYKKHLQPSDVDFDDTTVALELVLQAAAHANEMMKKLDRFGKVIEVQEQLGNSISLVSPGRELLKSGSVQKISSTTEKTEERFIFLFNDLVILASERKMIGVSKYKLRAVFSASHMQVCEGDNLEREHSFYLRGSDGTGPKRCVELFTPTQKEKNDWVDSIFSIIDEAKAHSLTFTSSSRSSISENNNNSIESKHCADCDIEFGFLHVKLDLKTSEEIKKEKDAMKDPKFYIRRMNNACKSVLDQLDKEYVPKKSSTETDETADEINAAHYSQGKVAAGFTSTVMAPVTSNKAAVLDNDTVRYSRVKKNAFVRLVTNFGPLNLELFAPKVPKACENFITHCSNGYYNNTKFHRLIKNFMLQGGDPTGTGHGGESIWDKPFSDEFISGFSHDARGVLSMANKGSNTNGSQFFITFRPCKYLDRKHTIFGRLVGGQDTLTTIEKLETEEGTDVPMVSVVIMRAEVFVDPFEEAEKEVQAERAEILKKTSKDAASLANKKAKETATKPEAVGTGVGKYMKSAAAVNKRQGKMEDVPLEAAKKTKFARAGLGDFSKW